MQEAAQESCMWRNTERAGYRKGGIPKGQDTAKDGNCHGRGKEMMGNDKDIDCRG